MLRINEQVQNKLHHFRCTAEQFALIAHLPPSTTAAWLRGAGRFDNQRELYINGLVEELIRLVEYARPFHIDFRKPEEVERMLVHFRNNTLPQIIREQQQRQESL